MADDPRLMALMRKSGCGGVLIGFESLSAATLAAMGKSWNRARRDYEESIRRIREAGIAIYATFVFGYDTDDADAFERTVEFAIGRKFHMAAFNHLVPFPGTPLYRRLQQEGRLRFDRWWLDPRYRFGDVAFHPAKHVGRGTGPSAASRPATPSTASAPSFPADGTSRATAGTCAAPPPTSGSTSFRAARCGSGRACRWELDLRRTCRQKWKSCSLCLMPNMHKFRVFGRLKIGAGGPLDPHHAGRDRRAGAGRRIPPGGRERRCGPAGLSGRSGGHQRAHGDLAAGLRAGGPFPQPRRCLSCWAGSTSASFPTRPPTTPTRS